MDHDQTTTPKTEDTRTVTKEKTISDYHLSDAIRCIERAIRELDEGLEKANKEDLDDSFGKYLKLLLGQTGARTYLGYALNQLTK